MEVFGWIALVILAAFGLFILGLQVAPYIVSKIKSFKYRVTTAVEDEKLDIERRSDERRRRDEIKREKDFELANKRLDAKLNKIDKQIKIHTEKLKLADELKKQTALEQSELQKSNDLEISTEIPKVEKSVTVKKVSVKQNEPKVEEIKESDEQGESV